jgi:heat shock protein HslJ
MRLWLVAALALSLSCAKKTGEQAAHGADSAAAGAAQTAAPVLADTLGRGPWRWVATVTPVERIVPSDPGRYTVEFLPDSTARVLLDCNRGSGAYHVAGKSIRVGPVAATRMMCPPGSLDAKFGQQLDAARTWFMRGDTLMIDLFADSGTMQFVR